MVLDDKRRSPCKSYWAKLVNNCFYLRSFIEITILLRQRYSMLIIAIDGSGCCPFLGGGFVVVVPVL